MNDADNIFWQEVQREAESGEIVVVVTKTSLPLGYEEDFDEPEDGEQME